MTSVHKESSHTTKKFSSGNGRSAADDFWDFDLPIRRKGRFFQDSSFAQERDEFDAAVRSVLRKWGDDDFMSDVREDAGPRSSSVLNRYRKMRADNLKEDNQAVTITDDDSCHKIVLDVHDFMEGDVKVKLVGERELVVEGQMGSSKQQDLSLASQSFKRRFSLPEQTDVNSITSVMSSDGILTITAPKKAKRDARNNATEDHTRLTEGQETSQQERMHKVSAENHSRAQDVGAEGTGKREAETKTHTQRSTSTKTELRDGSLHDHSLPIKRKGHYFDDSFFDDTRSHFHKAVNDILRDWGEPDLLGDAWDDNSRSSSVLNRYRKMRADNLKEDNQAVTITDDDSCHKIVLDVQDFMEGDVKVKLVGERELVVEGQMGSHKHQNLSLASQSFKRRFSLPELTDVDSITSVMSCDGILTITAPKKQVNRTKEEDLTIPIRVSAAVNQAKEQCTTSTSHIEKKECQKSESHDNSSQERQEESKIAMNETTTQTNGSLASEHLREATESEKRDDQKQCVSNVSTQTSSASSSNVRESLEATRGGSLLPIETKGVFFDDAFFKDTWEDYRDAVKDVVVKWGDLSTADDMTCYRKLRTRNLKEENQAVRSSEDESNYKFVVDIQDFMKGGDVTVKALDERELLVEGRVEREEGGVRSTKRFARHFVLPEDSRAESVSSVMSSDGVLTILAPKKSSGRQGTVENVQKVEERKEVRKDLSEEAAASSSSSVRSKTNTSVDFSSSSSSAVDSSVSSSDSLRAPSEATNRARGHSIPIDLEIQEIRSGSSEQLRSSSDAWNLNSETSQQQQQRESVPCKIQVNYDGEDIEKEAIRSKNLDFADEGDGVHRRLEEQNSKLEADSASQQQQQQQHFEVHFDEKYKNRSLPISTRGLFSDDSFFRDCRLGFKAAVREVLQKAQEPMEDDELAAYRSLRRRNLKLENQAVHVDDGLRYQTILLDVYDFLGGEVTVNVVEGKELVVEGRAKRRDGTSMTTLSFLRRFPLPEMADLETISAVMASDGVLIIGVPKLTRNSRVSCRREASSDRPCRLQEEMGRESSQGRSSRTSRQRESPEMYGESHWMTGHKDSRSPWGHRDSRSPWGERRARDSSEDSEESGRFHRLSHHKHLTSDLF